MIRIDGKLVEIQKQVTMTPKQKAKLDSLSESQKLKYILSLVGIKSNVKHQKALTKPDSLENKSDQSVLSLFRKRLDNSSSVEHSPLIRTKTSQWIGVEIECLIKGNDESSDCEYCGNEGTMTCHNCDGHGALTAYDSNDNEYEVSCGDCGGEGHRECHECDGNGRADRNSIHETIRARLRQAKITNCSVRSDGSLSDDNGKIGVEVTVLLDAQHGFGKIQKVCAILNELGASVNSTCGLHVHIDQAKSSIDDAMTNGQKLNAFLPILSRLVPSSRRKSTYCKLGMSKIEGDRYYAVNMTSMSKHKTIEVRLHSGTTDAKKIASWSKLLLSIVSMASVPSRRINSFQGLIDTLKLDADLVAYFDKRFQKFNPLDETHGPNAQPEIHDDETSGAETLSEVAV